MTVPYSPNGPCLLFNDQYDQYNTYSPQYCPPTPCSELPPTPLDAFLYPPFQDLTRYDLPQPMMKSSFVDYGMQQQSIAMTRHVRLDESYPCLMRSPLPFLEVSNSTASNYLLTPTSLRRQDMSLPSTPYTPTTQDCSPPGRAGRLVALPDYSPSGDTTALVSLSSNGPDYSSPATSLISLESSSGPAPSKAKRQRAPLRIPPGPRFLETLFIQHGRTVNPADRIYLDIRSARYPCSQSEAAQLLVNQSAKKFHDEQAMLLELRGLTNLLVVCVPTSEGALKLDRALAFVKGRLHSKSKDRESVEKEFATGVIRVAEPSPSRPMNCNFIFMSRRRAQIGKLFLDFLTDRTSQILGEEWRQLDRVEKNYWIELWEEYSIEFRRMFPSYRWRKSKSAVPEK